MTDRHVAASPRANLPAELAGLSALRHHKALALGILRLLPLARDPRIVGIPFQPHKANRIAEALRLDGLLPSEQEIDGLRLQIADALHGPDATMAEIAQVVPLLFGRASIKTETLPLRIGVLLEMLAFERGVAGFTLDVLMVAILTNLRTARFAPEPCELIELIGRARSHLREIEDEMPRLTEARFDADDLLIAAGLKPERSQDDWPVPWDDPPP